MSMKYFSEIIFIAILRYLHRLPKFRHNFRYRYAEAIFCRFI